jgi:DNA-binding IclR family transcriptional regulator
MDNWSTPLDVAGAPASPPTERVVATVQLLASEPRRGFTLAEIARSRSMNKATCLSVLTELVRWGWAIRDPAAKTYTLGPALLSVGRAAEESFPALQHARIALRDVVARHDDVPGVIAAHRGQQIATLDAFGDTERLGGDYRSGQLVPFVPPFGTAFVAWGPPEEVEAWFARSETPITDEDRAWFERVFASIRARLYGIDRLNATVLQVRQLLPALSLDPLTTDVAPALQAALRQLGARAQVVDELRPGGRFPAAILYAPVFDADAHPILNLSLHLLREDVAYEEVEVLAADVVDAARQVTLASGGRLPPDEAG